MCVCVCVCVRACMRVCAHVSIYLESRKILRLNPTLGAEIAQSVVRWTRCPA